MRKLLDLSGVAFIVVIATTALQLSGCATGFNSWTPRTGTSVEAYQERSCASGYYDCSIGSRGGEGGPH